MFNSLSRRSLLVSLTTIVATIPAYAGSFATFTVFNAPPCTNFIDDNGVTSWTDDNGVICFTDDNGA